MAKDIDIKEIIENTAKETARATVSEMRINNMVRKELTYYKRVELLLYNYENLKEAIKQKEEDIEYIDKNGLPEKSGSIVVYSTVGGVSKEDRYLELKERYIREKIETERDLKRIDNALDKIRDDKYFDIIQLKYLNKEEDKLNTDEEIAERINKERRTIIRNRKRLINKLITIFFPESIKDYA
ncbi:MAG: hypothetical protein KH333_09810 [Clostridium sp.]|nr:hypothetical protein [Clostridium sp.]